MKFKHVVIQALAAVEPPIRVTSREIELKLKPTLDRLGVRDDLLEEVSGIGVENGPWGLLGFTELQTVNIAKA